MAHKGDASTRSDRIILTDPEHPPQGRCGPAWAAVASGPRSHEIHSNIQKCTNLRGDESLLWKAHAPQRDKRALLDAHNCQIKWLYAMWHTNYTLIQFYTHTLLVSDLRWMIHDKETKKLLQTTDYNENLLHRVKFIGWTPSRKFSTVLLLLLLRY